MRAKRVFRRVKRPPFQNGGERQQIESFVRIEWTLLEKCGCEFRLSILPTITRILTDQTSRDTLKRHERNQIVRIHGRYWKSVGVNFAYRSFNITRNLGARAGDRTSRDIFLYRPTRERERSFSSCFTIEFRSVVSSSCFTRGRGGRVEARQVVASR